mmetsp:Transcript_39536/g.65285  ORF Transcript_39536/g.65285 Transcript_39536/m.65285 type:complete len:139 (-) Transcript_39536:42-458(-)
MAKRVRIGLAGLELHKEDLWTASDPYFTISTNTVSEMEFDEVIAYKSEHVDNDPSPLWMEVSLPLAQLCDGDLNRRLRIQVCDHNYTKLYELIGSFNASLEELKRGFERREPFPLKNSKYPGKEMGRIVVKHFEFIEY